MRITVLGNGGREHALGWKLANEGHRVTIAPGNPGISLELECVPVDLKDPLEVLEVLKMTEPDLVVVGPEEPLINGLADEMRAAGFKVFGTSKATAQLEGSKAYSKQLMASAGVPTAKFATFSDHVAARVYAAEIYGQGGNLVVKASGNALGKGVVVPQSFDEALHAIDQMMVKRIFGPAGDTVVLEERLPGKEFSLLTLAGGIHFHSLPASQDHKRVFDGDEGPNTGGMGTYSPVPWVTDDLVEQVERDCVKPVLQKLSAEGTPFTGCLFTGFMVHEGQVSTLEYNVRFGDPETQSVVLRLGQGLGEAMLAVAEHRTIPPIRSLAGASCSVVMASKGYPGPLETGFTIEVPPSVQSQIFYAGVGKNEEGKLVNTGGRVLCVSASGSNIEDARAKAYADVAKISFEGAHFRTDIAESLSSG